MNIIEYFNHENIELAGFLKKLKRFQKANTENYTLSNSLEKMQVKEINLLNYSSIENIINNKLYYCFNTNINLYLKDNKTLSNKRINLTFYELMSLVNNKFVNDLLKYFNEKSLEYFENNHFNISLKDYYKSEGIINNTLHKKNIRIMKNSIKDEHIIKNPYIILFFIEKENFDISFLSKYIKVLNENNLLDNNICKSILNSNYLFSLPADNFDQNFINFLRDNDFLYRSKKITFDSKNLKIKNIYSKNEEEHCFNINLAENFLLKQEFSTMELLIKNNILLSDNIESHVLDIYKKIIANKEKHGTSLENMNPKVIDRYTNLERKIISNNLKNTYIPLKHKRI